MATKTYKKISNEGTVNMVSESSTDYNYSVVFHNFSLINDFSLIKKAREGVKTEVFYSLAEAMKLSEKFLASVINLSPRTISNYRDQNKFLEPNYSEHLLKLIVLFEKGEEYLGNVSEFKNWLEKPFWNSSEKPIDFINTSGGVDYLIDYLERMAQGYPI